MGVCSSNQKVQDMSPGDGGEGEKKAKEVQANGKKSHQSGNGEVVHKEDKKASKTKDKKESKHKRSHRSRTHKSSLGVERTQSGLNMRPAENSDALQMEILHLTKEEIAKLFESFDIIRHKRDAIAAEIYKRLNKVPDAIDRLDKGTSQYWTGLSQAVVLLSGVERCLLRINDQEHLKKLTSYLVVNHVKHHNVSQKMFLDGLDVTAAVVLKFMGDSHSPPKDEYADEENAKHLWQNCITCSTWARFFELLRKTLESIDPDTSDSPQRMSVVISEGSTGEKEPKGCPVAGHEN